MGLFGIGSSSPFDADVEKATSETNTAEQWDVIIDICDKVGANSKNAKDCLRSIMKRMGHNDPHVAIQAVTLLDACVKNCGQKFHLEIASRDFETEFRRLLTKVPAPIASKMRVSLKKWAENEFKNDSELNLIPTLYNKLKAEGFDFTDHSTTIPKPAPISKDPNVVSSQQEEDDIAKAIELSLKDKGEGAKATTGTSFQSLYPTMPLNGGNSPGKSIALKIQPEARKVRALYDFEAAEDNELTFFAGEIIHVLDDTDPNWWKGYNDRGEGLFPSNFVSADLSAEPESSRIDNKSKRSVQFADDEQQKAKEEVIEINEAKIDRLLHLLHEANPEDPSQDSAEMYLLEDQVNQMLPLIDAELERVDRNHAKLTQLSSNLVDAINMYHTLMRDADLQLSNYAMGMGPQQMYGPVPGAGQLAGGGALYGVPGNPNLYSLPPGVHLPSHPMGNPMSVPNAMMPRYSAAITHPQRQMIPPHLQNGHQSLQHPMQLPPHSQQLPQQQQMQHPPHFQQFSQQLPQQPSPTQADQLHQLQQRAINIISNPGQSNIQTNANNMNSNAALVQQQHYNGLPQQQHFQAINPSQQQPHHQSQQPPPQHQSQPHLMTDPMNTHPNQILSSFPPNTVMSTHVQQPANMGPLQISQQVRASPIHNVVGPNMAINQPVTSTILPQSDSRTNIPIYQQQR